jgi:molybdopterin/thiamine biosynthesis adenylyltransferase
MAQGMIPGSFVVPRGVLEKAMPQVAPDHDTEVVLYCDAGHRSALAALVLEEMGYTRVASLAGGIARWRAEGREITIPRGPSVDPRARYARHLVLPEIGEEGQKRLLASSVLVVGAGGLGSPAAYYLAAAGVGTLGIVDYDVVDVSNLQRQILHGVDRIGADKVDSAAATLRRLNPDITIQPLAVRLEAGNVLELASGFDVVVDGTDTFPARYLLNDAAVHLKVPVVHGSVIRFEGQATVVRPYHGPCYRCLFPVPPPPELSPSCSEAGVLGAVPGVIGSIQAVETIKLLLGIGETLAGRLLVFDGLGGETRIFTLERDPHCPACGDPARPPTLVDYDETCTPG